MMNVVAMRKDSQARPKAQRSDRCLVGVRRFESCSLHSSFLSFPEQLNKTILSINNSGGYL
jgi:hypothetical protein